MTALLAPEPLRIDVWGDIGCPWCYIGKHRLEQAIARMPAPDAIAVVPHAFELDPTLGPEPVRVLDLLAAKYGLGPHEVAQMEERVVNLAHADGLAYTADRPHASSFDAHRVLALAAERGVAGQLLDTIQRALFGEGADVYDHGFLAAAAAALGIPRDRVDEVLAGDEYADAVRRDEARAASLGVTGVPFAVIGGRLAIPGAIAVDGYVQAIERVRA